MDYSWQVLVTVFTLGGVGAVIRGAILGLMKLPALFWFPIGVLFVNVLASFLGAFISSMMLPEGLSIALVVGLVGGIGTLSAFCTDIFELWNMPVGRMKKIFFYVIFSTLLGLLSAQLGLSLGQYIHQQRLQEQEQMRQMLNISSGLQQSTLESEDWVHDHGASSEHLHQADTDTASPSTPPSDVPTQDSAAQDDATDAPVSSSTESSVESSAESSAASDAGSSNHENATEEKL